MGYWTTVRINPLFPIYPDGYFTDSDFTWNGQVPKFNYSSFEMVNEIADAGVPSVLAGFGRFSSSALNSIAKVTGTDLKPFFRIQEAKKSSRDFHFSSKEIRYYYDQLKNRSIKRAMEFSTCYIGNGEHDFWSNQDLWSNEKDCCNVKNRVASFKSDAREIPFSERLAFTSYKDAKPFDPQTLHKKLDAESPLRDFLGIPPKEMSPDA
jgi:hypothetical protein